MSVFTEEQLLNNILQSKLSTNETVNILCCVNDEYVNSMINLMYSVRHFCNKKIKLFILTTHLSKKNNELILEQMDYLGINPNIEKVVDVKRFEKQLNGWSLEVYLKLYSFKILPGDVEKVLYLDADTLATDDIFKIYNIDIENYLIAATYDIDMLGTNVFERRKKFGISHDYFNAGVVLLNLKQQRKRWNIEEINDLIETVDCDYPTQDFLNILCEEKDVKFLPFRANFQTWGNIKEESDLKCGRVSIIHYITNQKPWITKNFSLYSTKLFYECAAMTHIPEFCPAEYFEERLIKNINKSKTNKKELNLLCCINDGFARPLVNLMYSIRQYNYCKINLYVLSTKLSPNLQEEIKLAGKKININVSIQVCQLPEFYIGSDYWSLDMYLRILAFEYLPKELDKILYMDSDMQAFNDIEEIFDMDISNHTIAARKEPWRFVDNNIKNSCANNNYDHEYFNSGVLLMNLKKIREIWTKEKIIELITTMKLIFPDQDVLNKLCCEKEIYFMNDRYNCFHTHMMTNYDEVIIDSPILMHYVGPEKPWTAETVKYQQTFFFKSAKLTGIEEYITKGKTLNLF